MNSSASAEATDELAGLDAESLEAMLCDWNFWATEKQKAPHGDWVTWLLLGGRGSGKTRAGAEWVRSLAQQKIGPIALVGETMTEAIAIMVRGESGLLNVHRDDERPTLKGNELHWPNGVVAMVLSASDPERFRGPQFAAAWCDELGCAAVDKGANQPNIFGDSKSAEGGRPYFSSGRADPLIQRQFLRAHHRFWADPQNNPAGMVDPERIYCWTWDARPFPAFPGLPEVWADSVNHRTGHWLTGRLGVLASDELASAIAADHGVVLAAEAAVPLVSGYLLSETGSARDAIEPLAQITGLGIRNLAGGLLLGAARSYGAIALTTGDLAAGDDVVVSRRRGDSGDAPGRLALSYIDRGRDYRQGAVTALSSESGPLAREGLPMVLDPGGARLAAERLLDARSARHDTLRFALPPDRLTIEPGDVVTLDGSEPFEITEIRDAALREVTARSLVAPMAMAVEDDDAILGHSGFAAALPVLVAAHLPATPDDAGRTRLVLGAWSRPWPGVVQVTDDVTGAALLDLLRPANMGALETAMLAGPSTGWDGESLTVRLRSGHLAAATPAAVLAGANRLAIEQGSGRWEVIGFAQAELAGPGLYRITQLLRGLDGTEATAVNAGARVMLLDNRTGMLPVTTADLGETRRLRFYAGRTDLEGQVLDVTPDRLVAAPLAPVHLQTLRLANGDVALRWTRRSRAEGDGWGTADAPLDHAPERYVVRILSGAVVVRSLEAIAPQAIYAAGDQTADFGLLPDSFGWSVAQVSMVLGEGHEATGDFA